MDNFSERLAHFLKELCDGQGIATISVSWDSATDDPSFDIIVNRERDGELLRQKELTELSLFHW